MRRFFVGILTVLGLSAMAGAMPAAAQDSATPVPEEPRPGAALTIAKMNCPPVMPDENLDPANCTTPAQGVQFFVANPNTDNIEFGATKGDGLVSFPLDNYILSPDGSEVSLGEVLANNPYGEVTGYTVACTRNGDALGFDYEQIEVQPGGMTYGIRFTAHPGDQIACEWYDALASTGGEQPDPGQPGADQPGADKPAANQPDTHHQSSDPVKTLPATGSGAAIAGGSSQPAWLLGGAMLTLAGGLGIRRATRR